MMQILTPNLRLVPDTLDRLMTLFDGADVFEKKFGVRVAAGITETYRDVPRAGLAAVVSACAVAGWILGFSIEHAEDNTLIGSCAFKGPPDSKRAVEIAYFVAPGYRGRGFAGEAARALVAHGFETGRVAIVRAHTLPDPNASTHVLRRCGFQYIGEMMDPEDGLVWRWEIRAAASV